MTWTPGLFAQATWHDLRAGEFRTNGWVLSTGALAALTAGHHYTDALPDPDPEPAPGAGCHKPCESHQARLPERRLLPSWLLPGSDVRVT